MALAIAYRWNWYQRKPTRIDNFTCLHFIARIYVSMSLVLPGCWPRVSYNLRKMFQRCHHLAQFSETFADLERPCLWQQSRNICPYIFDHPPHASFTRLSSSCSFYREILRLSWLETFLAPVFAPSDNTTDIMGDVLPLTLTGCIESIPPVRGTRGLAPYSK